MKKLAHKITKAEEEDKVFKIECGHVDQERIRLVYDPEQDEEVRHLKSLIENEKRKGKILEKKLDTGNLDKRKREAKMKMLKFELETLTEVEKNMIERLRSLEMDLIKKVEDEVCSLLHPFYIS